MTTQFSLLGRAILIERWNTKTDAFETIEEIGSLGRARFLHGRLGHLIALRDAENAKVVAVETSADTE